MSNDLNGFLCCGKHWDSSWCGHECSRAINHNGIHRCGWCGNPQVESADVQYEDDYIVTDGEHALRRRRGNMPQWILDRIIKEDK